MLEPGEKRRGRDLGRPCLLGSLYQANPLQLFSVLHLSGSPWGRPTIPTSTITHKFYYGSKVSHDSIQSRGEVIKVSL